MKWSRGALLYARVAVGSAFLSAVASRFGLWQGTVSHARFAEFVAYTGEVNAFMPRAAIPTLAWLATIAELALGMMLIAGVRLRIAGRASAVLLALFALAMAISFGFKSPLDYSVFTASSAALLVSEAARDESMPGATE